MGLVQYTAALKGIVGKLSPAAHCHTAGAVAREGAVFVVHNTTGPRGSSEGMLLESAHSFTPPT